MIKFIDINRSKPYKIFLDIYKTALSANQKYIEAASISSFSKRYNEVRSRYVNIKYIKNDNWIFFTNYDSPKNEEFLNHKQISCIFFWNELNIQIRLKAKIKKLSKTHSDNHFKERSIEKNALAICSNQSREIASYASMIKKYNDVINSDLNLRKRPDHWGGYRLTPNKFEFWQGRSNRLHDRLLYQMQQDAWTRARLAP